MTDYLEALLDGGEDTPEALRPGKPAVLRRKRTGKTALGVPSAGKAGADAPTPETVETVSLQGNLREETPIKGGNAGFPAEAEAGVPWLMEEEGGGVSPASGLYAALTRAGRAAGAVRRGSTGGITVTLPAGESASFGPDMAALDRAVQRDARRYDGGFALY